MENSNINDNCNNGRDSEETIQKSIESENIGTQQNNGNALLGMTSEDTAAFLKDALKMIQPVLDFFTTNTKAVEAPIKKAAIGGFIAIIVLILAGSMILVFCEKMDASNLALIIGIVLGYLFTMAKNFIGANGN